MELAGTSSLVTGGASGLGLATARRLAAGGSRVVIIDLASSDGEQVAAELGGGARFVPSDVRDEAQVQAAVDVAAEGGAGWPSSSTAPASARRAGSSARRACCRSSNSRRSSP